MLASRSALAFTSLILTAGALLLQFLVLLAGVRDANPLNQIYFFRAETSDIQDAPPSAQWTLWNYCDASVGGRSSDCGGIRPAYPFDPVRNFGDQDAIPDAFKGTNMYYYLTRFMFAFFLIAIFFAACSLFTGFLALCARIGGAISGLLASVALFFQTITAALMTACYVMARNVFLREDRAASLGIKAFGLMWAAVACLFLTTILFCLVLATGKKDDTYSSRSTKKSRFGRKQSTRSRGSFIDSEKRTSY
ncbi:MAG: hypothetical protein M1837_006711 [Sclerophora amabilis]|nr:MAG: hypothetical protein M1837_006711 [Sclerophora amabilis]